MDDIENKFMRLTAKPSVKNSESSYGRSTLSSNNNLTAYDERVD